MRYDPFDLDSPAVLAFSGGRTSGYLLWRVLQLHGGTLPAGHHVVFCNTGKEREETLEFVHACSENWRVPITWLEYRNDSGTHTFDVVDYATASRKGEPFERAIAQRSYLPNRLARYCTAELKVKPALAWARAQGFSSHVRAVGLRADEPARVERLLAGKAGYGRAGEEIACPLHEAGITLLDVHRFWAQHHFDLRLRPEEGNCDLCFLKRKGVILQLMHEHPELAAWWVAQERDGKLFRASQDRPSYELLLAQAVQPFLFDDDEEDLPCACTD